MRTLQYICVRRVGLATVDEDTVIFVSEELAIVCVGQDGLATTFVVLVCL